MFIRQFPILQDKKSFILILDVTYMYENFTTWEVF